MVISLYPLTNFNLYVMKIFLPLLLLMLTGCAVQVKTFIKPEHSLDQYETWCWLQGCEVTYQGPTYYYDQKVVDEIANAIAYNMHDKGYRQEDERSDLMVNFFLVIEEDSTNVSPIYEGDDIRLNEWYFDAYPAYEKFLKGSLTIDVIDRDQSEVIWRSHAIKYMEINPTYDRSQIWKGVRKAMKNFPDKSL